MHIIVEHEQFSEVLRHPVPLRDKTDYAVGVTHYLTLRVVLPVYISLTLCYTNNRVGDKLLRENPVVPLMTWNDYLQGHGERL